MITRRCRRSVIGKMQLSSKVLALFGSNTIKPKQDVFTKFMSFGWNSRLLTKHIYGDSSSCWVCLFQLHLPELSKEPQDRFRDPLRWIWQLHWSPDFHKPQHWLVEHSDILSPLELVFAWNQCTVFPSGPITSFSRMHSYPDKSPYFPLGKTRTNMSNLKEYVIIGQNNQIRPEAH